MDHYTPAGKGNFLLLQHQPAIAPVLSQAASSLACKISIANDSRQFFRQYHESLLNPFQIFGAFPFTGIILDLVNAFQKSMAILRDLREEFPGIPPVIGLCPPVIARQPGGLLEKGFDALLAFPAGEKSLRGQLRDFLLKNQVIRPLQMPDLFADHLESLPVLNLKTLGVLGELARMQAFPLEELLKSFFDEMEGFISKLIRQYEQGNIGECERLIISIRSLGGTLGASQLAQSARNMEFCLKSGASDKIGLWLPYLIEQFLTLREFLEEKPLPAQKAALLD